MQLWVMGETALRQKDSELCQAVHTALLTVGVLLWSAQGLSGEQDLHG